MRLKPVLYAAQSLLLLGAFACKNEEKPNNPDAPTFDVTVAPLTIQAGGEFTVNMSVKNFELDLANFGGTAEPGKGHWHVYLDQKVDNYDLKGSAAETETVTMPIGAADGPHKLVFVLHNNDHTELSPGVEKTVDVTVEAAPPPEMTATVSPLTVPAGGKLTVNVTVTNFTLDQAGYGGPNEDRHGHYHVYLDQKGEDYLLKATAQSPYELTLPVDTSPGAHELIITLNNNDHTPVSPAVEQTIAITVEPPPDPTLSVTIDNDTIEAGQYFVATVSVEYFVLDEEGYEGPNEDRHGHWHVYLNQIGEDYLLKATALPQERVQIPADAPAGSHELIFTLNNNDHSPLTPPVEYRVPITVVVVAPPPPDAVVVQGNVTKLGAYLGGVTEYVGDASLLVYGVNPPLTAVADPTGAYELQVPANGNAVVFANKAGYNPSYNTVTTAEQNLVGQKIYMAEANWISAIAANHQVDLASPFPCHAPALDPGINCIYGVIVGQILDDGYAGNGEIRPVAGIGQADFTVTGGPAGAEWYTKGPYFLNYDGQPGQYDYSVDYYDEANGAYRGGYFVAFVELPQLDGPPSVDFKLSISYDDQERGITRYFGPIDAKVFRPYGVTWLKLPETGIQIDEPLTGINFDTQIYPLFLPVADGGLGCQGCHTNAGGATPAGGMNLYGGPEVAFASLDPASYPQRVNLQDPEASYVLKRPLYETDGQQDHPIFAFASPQDIGYRTILTWIQEGAQREVVLQPVSFYNEVRPGLYNTPQEGGWGCRNCHYDGVNAQTAPGGFFISNDPAELYTEMVDETPNTADPGNGYPQTYRINKDGYPERSLVLVRPLNGNGIPHAVKIFYDNTDPRYQLIYRWITEGYQNDTP